MLQDYERMNLADALMSKKFKDGDCVINQVNVETTIEQSLCDQWQSDELENSKKCKFLA